MTYADLLRKIRQRKQLSQEDLAKKLDISFATINRWETEKLIICKKFIRR